MSEAKEQILNLKHLKKSYGNHQVLRDISFNVNKGEIVTIDQVLNRPNTPCLSLDDDVKGITAAIKAIVKYDGRKDLGVIK